MTKISIKGQQLSLEVAKDVLKDHEIKPTKTNLNKLVDYTVDKNDNNYLARPELEKGANELAKHLGRPETHGSALKPNKPLQTILGDAVPPSVSKLYAVSLSEDRKELTFDPAMVKPKVRALGATAHGINVEDTIFGGKRIELEGGPFKDGKWVTKSLASVVKDSAQLDKLKDAGYDVDAKRSLLVVNGDHDPLPTIFAFSRDPDSKGAIAVCSEVTLLDFSEHGPIYTIKKPVIYLYPEKVQHVTVSVKLDGEMIAEYPKSKNGSWEMMAGPDGTLFDRATEKRYGYLFWEGSYAKGFEIDPQQAFMVASSEVESFLDRVADAYALNAKERTDFVSYWIAPMSKNPYNLVQMLSPEAYGQYADMTIAPKPETTIRLFMVFMRVPEPKVVGSPELPTMTRRGFTVVEWGGTNLDET
ncbi:MAG: hypothetical protein HY791_28030 [Deltaproteobacteria bacterium]|nr:hypothetical protein [Deltaproteobacteria bacterium]